MASANSASSTGLLMNVSVPSRTRSSSACGVPCHSRADSTHWYQERLESSSLACRARRSARAAFTSALTSSIDMGAMPASATRSAMESSASAACRRLMASLSKRAKAWEVKRPAARRLRGGVRQLNLNCGHCLNSSCALTCRVCLFSGWPAWVRLSVNEYGQYRHCCASSSSRTKSQNPTAGVLARFETNQLNNRPPARWSWRSPTRPAILIANAESLQVIRPLS